MMPKDISRTMKMPNQLIFLRYCEKDNNKTIKRHIVVQQKNNLATADRQKGRMLSDYLMAARDAFGSLLKAINSSVALVWRTIKDISGTTDGQSRLSQTSQSPTPGYFFFPPFLPLFLFFCAFCTLTHMFLYNTLLREQYLKYFVCRYNKTW